MRGLIYLIAAALMMAAAGCSPRVVTRTVERAVERTDTLREVIMVSNTDTVREKFFEYDSRYDSVAPILDSLNRIIGWERWHFRERSLMSERERARMQAVIDSLKAAGTKAETEYKYIEVERKLSWWEQARLDYGGWAMVVCAVGVVAAVVWCVRKYRRYRKEIY